MLDIDTDMGGVERPQSDSNPRPSWCEEVLGLKM